MFIMEYKNVKEKDFTVKKISVKFHSKILMLLFKFKMNKYMFLSIVIIIYNIQLFVDHYIYTYLYRYI